MKRRIDSFLKAACLAAVLLLSTATANPGSPDAVIEGAVTELTDKLSGRKEELAEDRDALYALINDILLPRFDRKLAAQLVLASRLSIIRCYESMRMECSSSTKIESMS
jgi:ABC-type transporter MlaC component